MLFNFNDKCIVAEALKSSPTIKISYFKLFQYLVRSTNFIIFEQFSIFTKSIYTTTNYYVPRHFGPILFDFCCISLLPHDKLGL